MLGCGRIGRLLLQKESRFTIIDEEGNTLSQEGYCAIQGDPTNKDVLQKAKIKKADIVVIMDEVPVSLVRDMAPDAVVIACIDIDTKIPEIYEKADFVIPNTEFVVKECLDCLHHVQIQRKKKDLENVLTPGDTMAIILHDNPDPDCISSALALQLIVEKAGVVSELFYGGHIGYLENKVLVDILKVSLVAVSSPMDFSQYDHIAFVDHSPWDYTSIARDVNPDIVIDHHIPPSYESKFMDVREDVGATSTILTEYLQLFDVEITPELATGLFYGLLVDTNNFRRGITTHDIQALTILKDKIDAEILSQIERARFREEFEKDYKTYKFWEVLGDAVKNIEVKNNVLFSYVGEVGYRDAVSNSADFLLKIGWADIVVVYGVINDIVHVSARSWDETVHIGKLLRKALKDTGRAGGHPLSGGATIPLSNLSKNFKEDINTQILKALHS